ncbi:MAG: sigma-54-dependent Fis family transcriptional regulator [Symbiobacteriaceae bacterium]|nr:sigma-54-dependent Fis family transcriptional regulator [Symbiobacteriaceae bacterium]
MRPQSAAKRRRRSSRKEGLVIISLEPLLHALLLNVDEGIHVVDRQGFTVWYNPQAGLNDGLEPDEVKGKHLLEVYPSLNEHTSTILKVLETGTPIVNQQQTFTNYKGLRVTTINSTWPVHDAGGQLVGAIEISKDVTRVRELSEQVVDLRAELLGRRKGQGQAAARSDARYTLDDLIGAHPLFVALKEQAQLAARGVSPVLVCGETGTGKELLVHAIHHASPRGSGPLVTQNCAALPEGLLEGILFGTVRGSFTGAEDRPGLFELADGGTLYLDEINSMDMNLQAKLLRVLQDGRIRRVGDVRERRVDVRVVASTNEDPLEAVQQRRLRQDLYYRINVVSLEIPPLRERLSDIPLLTEHFLRKHRAALGARVRAVDAALERFFLAYGWPGNVRELEHAVQASLHMAKGDKLILNDLPAHLQRAAGALRVEVPAGPEPAEVSVNPRELKASLERAERGALLSALAQCDWNLSQVSRLLGMPRQTLQYRMKRLGLSRAETGRLS